MVDERPVRHGHRLRAPGRAAGKDHVGELLGASGSRLIARGNGAAGRPVNEEHLDREVVQPRRQPLIGQREAGLGVGQHELESPARLGGVKRQVGSAGVKDAQDGGHQLGSSRQQDGHHRARASAVGAKAGCYLTGPGLELRIRELTALPLQRCSVGPRRGPLAQQLVQQPVGHRP